MVAVVVAIVPVRLMADVGRSLMAMFVCPYLASSVVLALTNPGLLRDCL